jgi:tripartite-type tricarboxylate transporter receptor subunit TctC
MGDKVAARKLAEEARVPVVPGSRGTVAPQDAVAAADSIGYPVMIKAAGGGGDGASASPAARPKQTITLQIGVTGRILPTTASGLYTRSAFQKV